MPVSGPSTGTGGGSAAGMGANSVTSAGADVIAVAGAGADGATGARAGAGAGAGGVARAGAGTGADASTGTTGKRIAVHRVSMPVPTAPQSPPQLHSEDQQPDSDDADRLMLPSACISESKSPEDSLAELLHVARPDDVGEEGEGRGRAEGIAASGAPPVGLAASSDGDYGDARYSSSTSGVASDACEASDSED